MGKFEWRKQDLKSFAVYDVQNLPGLSYEILCTLVALLTVKRPKIRVESPKKRLKTIQIGSNPQLW